MGFMSDFFNWYHDNGILPNLWKGATGQLSQEQMADENLEYQKERNAIEDERYKTETEYAHARDELADTRYKDELEYSRGRDVLADTRYNEELEYNRAWAEDEREYNRELQKQLFEREDTAITRQANELSKLGINPLSQNMNGLGSGSVVSSAVAPSSGVSTSNGSLGMSTQNSGFSSRGGKALNKQMQTLDSLLPLAQLAGDITESIQGVQSGSLQRDALQLQNDRMFLENYEFARDLGMTYEPSKGVKKRGSKRFMQYFTEGSADEKAYKMSIGYKNFKKYDEMRDMVNSWKRGYYSTDTDLMRNLKQFSTEDYSAMAEKIVTNAQNIFEH